MNKCASEADVLASCKTSLELRCAQRAFAAVIDAHRPVGEFREAQLRSLARRTLSALSADDRAQLADWISLQLAVGARNLQESVLGLLARIETRLVARVTRALPLRVEALAMRDGTSHIVAA
jgi:hypothetical protein